MLNTVQRMHADKCESNKLGLEGLRGSKDSGIDAFPCLSEGLSMSEEGSIQDLDL